MTEWYRNYEGAVKEESRNDRGIIEIAKES